MGFVHVRGLRFSLEPEDPPFSPLNLEDQAPNDACSILCGIADYLTGDATGGHDCPISGLLDYPFLVYHGWFSSLRKFCDTNDAKCQHEYLVSIVKLGEALLTRLKDLKRTGGLDSEDLM